MIPLITIPYILSLSIFNPLTQASNCFFPQPGLIPPSPSDCEAAINLIPPGLIFDPHQAGSPERLNLSIPDTHLRAYELPGIFIAKSCSITVKLDDVGLSPSDLYFQFWPAVRDSAKQIVSQCVDGQILHGTWGGYGTGSYAVPGKVERGYLVSVKGWNLSIYTPHGELVV